MTRPNGWIFKERDKINIMVKKVIVYSDGVSLYSHSRVQSEEIKV